MACSAASVLMSGCTLTFEAVMAARMGFDSPSKLFFIER